LNGGNRRSNDETLLYAPEIKFFATQIETTPHRTWKPKSKACTWQVTARGVPATSYQPQPPD